MTRIRQRYIESGPCNGARDGCSRRAEEYLGMKTCFAVCRFAETVESVALLAALHIASRPWPSDPAITKKEEGGRGSGRTWTQDGKEVC
jgi:hypothetical protein